MRAIFSLSTLWISCFLSACSARPTTSPEKAVEQPILSEKVELELKNIRTKIQTLEKKIQESLQEAPKTDSSVSRKQAAPAHPQLLPSSLHDTLSTALSSLSQSIRDYPELTEIRMFREEDQEIRVNLQLKRAPIGAAPRADQPEKIELSFRCDSHEQKTDCHLEGGDDSSSSAPPLNPF